MICGFDIVFLSKVTDWVLHGSFKSLACQLFFLFTKTEEQTTLLCVLYKIKSVEPLFLADIQFVRIHFIS